MGICILGKIQLVKGDVLKLPEKPKQQQAIINKMDKIGKAANTVDYAY